MLSKDEVARMPRGEWLARLGRAADALDAALAGQPEAALARRPDAKSWAPKEVVCHLRDTEEFFMLRFRTVEAAAAGPEPRLLPVDPDRWAEERQYIRNDAAEAARAYRRRREESLAHLARLGEADWERGGLHPTYGRMTVRDFVAMMVWHDDNHLEQLRRGLRGEP